MAYTTITKSSSFMNTVLYTGNDTTNAITGVGFQPDLTWLKRRNGAYSNYLFDVLRGALYEINSNSNEASTSLANSLTAFDSDGFTLGSEGLTNANNDTFASWNWKANGAGSANTDGSINTTSTSANTTAGISISTYTGTGANATVGHGLGVVPKMIFTKVASDAEDWMVYHEFLGNTTGLRLNGINAQLSANVAYYNNTSPTSSVFTVGTHPTTNWSTKTMIAYCFAEVAGYSKFGHYVGNNNADGTFTYTGFKPSFVIIKKTTATDHWVLMDNKRNGYNFKNMLLCPSDNGAAEDGALYGVDFLSNGFKCRTTDGWTNGNSTYIYMAFGQTLVGTNDVPCTAR